MADMTPLPERGNLPSFFTDMLIDQYGPKVAGDIVGGLGRRPVTARANALKGDAATVRRELDELGVGWSGVAWYEDALVLEGVHVRDVNGWDMYSQGRIYLQSLSSMIPPIVLAPKPGADVLDMCAAPGGKTTQIAALTSGTAHVTACEMHMPRAERLEHNLRVQGAGSVSVMRCDARRLDPYFRFDQILLDAPCTGSGTLDRADARVPSRLTPELLKKTVRSQRALLKKAVELLKPGGVLVYSTCSVLRQENEDAIAEVMRGGAVEPDPIDEGAFEGVPLLPCSTPGALKVRPDGMYEGFFVARMRRVSVGV